MDQSIDGYPIDGPSVGSIDPSFVSLNVLSQGTVDGAVDGPSTDLLSIDGKSLALPTN